MSSDKNLNTEKTNITSSDNLGGNIIFNSFSNLLGQYIQNVVNDISFIISEEKKVNKDEIIAMWNLISPEYEIGVKTKQKKTLDKACEWTGNKNGKCNIKVSVNSKSGKFCFRHLKYENSVSPSEEGSDNEQKLTQEIPIEQPKKEFRIKFNRKAKLYLDEEFNYVFDRLTKGVYGKYVENEICTLSEYDIQFIKLNGGIIKE